MINGQELEMALGLPIEISTFLDGSPRKCYPYKMTDLYRANTYLSFFDQVDMVGNIQDENKSVAMVCFLSESFKDVSVKELLENVTNELFSELIEDIKFVNGIIDSQGEKDLNGSNEAVDWSVSVNAIQTYTANTYEDIKNMTLTQFQSLLEFVGRKINWEYKTGMLDLVAEPNDFIEPEEHPLANKARVQARKHMTMKDVLGLQD